MACHLNQQLRATSTRASLVTHTPINSPPQSLLPQRFHQARQALTEYFADVIPGSLRITYITPQWTDTIHPTQGLSGLQDHHLDARSPPVNSAKHPISASPSTEPPKRRASTLPRSCSCIQPERLDQPLPPERVTGESDCRPSQKGKKKKKDCGPRDVTTTTARSPRRDRSTLAARMGEASIIDFQRPLAHNELSPSLDAAPSRGGEGGISAAKLATLSSWAWLEVDWPRARCPWLVTSPAERVLGNNILAEGCLEGCLVGGSLAPPSSAAHPPHSCLMIPRSRILGKRCLSRCVWSQVHETRTRYTLLIWLFRCPAIPDHTNQKSSLVSIP